MADSFVLVVGNLTADPQLRFTQQGVPVASFRVAVSTRYRHEGAWQEGQPSFVQVTVWHDQALHAIDSLTKGTRVVVAGRLKTRTHATPDGQRRTFTDIVADEVALSLRFAPAHPHPPTRSGPRHQPAGLIQPWHTA